MFLPLGGSSVILFPAHSRTLDRAFSSGGERFPDTEEVTSSNLVTPTKCSQLRGFASELFCFTPTSQESTATPKAAPTTPANIPTGPEAALIAPAITPAERATTSTPAKTSPIRPKAASTPPTTTPTELQIAQTALPAAPIGPGWASQPLLNNRPKLKVNGFPKK